MYFDRNKLVFDPGTQYWEFKDYIEQHMPYCMPMDISKHNQRLDDCKAWLFDQGKGTWAINVVGMTTVHVYCSDKQDALMVKLKFGGK